MNNLKIIKLRIDDREFSFQGGLNFIIGKNGSGKTTIFNCIKYVLGLTLDIQQYFFKKLELVASIDDKEFEFRRENGNAFLEIKYNNDMSIYRARSKQLDDFFLEIFSPKFPIGNKLISIFPILDFCFIANEAPLNSKSLWSAIRLICGANDKLLSTAMKDVEVLRSQISSEETFLSKNDMFIADFLDNLNGLIPEASDKIKKSLDVARKKIIRLIEQKREILLFSTERIEELKTKNEIEFLNIIHDVEYQFSHFIESFPTFGSKALKVKDVVSRNIGNVSHGETVFANFLVLMAIARSATNSNVNYPNIYVNDGFISRSLDNHRTRQVYNLLEIQAKNNNEFQYIEFTSNSNIPLGFVAGDLDGKEWRA